MKQLFRVVFAALLACSLVQGASAANVGTADEAVAMVKKAAAYIAANGKDKAFAEISNPSGQFKDRDLYIAVLDKTGLTLAHGGNPKLIGKSMIDLKDVDDKHFIKAFLDVAATKGSGWVDYKWPNPVSKAIEKKSTYVEKTGDLVIICGIYKG
ncbi:cache domain-containing protein [Pseudoduganella aquatica]|uniref:Histidine kinase n=1 Tax=Pseudoduganella aquatica TaxID=2660641 RepID=A0A7X4HC21_9BURK|nr:cache domain-containing protein [Pseudoduganella aquatica]MYN08489.1 histidine kinase [Pseudoduganella aquatica]